MGIMSQIGVYDVTMVWNAMMSYIYALIWYNVYQLVIIYPSMYMWCDKIIN